MSSKVAYEDANFRPFLLTKENWNAVVKGILSGARVWANAAVMEQLKSVLKTTCEDIVEGAKDNVRRVDPPSYRGPNSNRQKNTQPRDLRQEPRTRTAEETWGRGVILRHPSTRIPTLRIRGVRLSFVSFEAKIDKDANVFVITRMLQKDVDRIIELKKIFTHLLVINIASEEGMQQDRSSAARILNGGIKMRQILDKGDPAALKKLLESYIVENMIHVHHRDRDAVKNTGAGPSSIEEAQNDRCIKKRRIEHVGKERRNQSGDRRRNNSPSPKRRIREEEPTRKRSPSPIYTSDDYASDNGSGQSERSDNEDSAEDGNEDVESGVVSAVNKVVTEQVHSGGAEEELQRLQAEQQRQKEMEAEERRMREKTQRKTARGSGKATVINETPNRRSKRRPGQRTDGSSSPKQVEEEKPKHVAEHQLNTNPDPDTGSEVATPVTDSTIPCGSSV